jgi:signal transduction histidine kinase/ActR/RegA family two-component response regulator
VPVGNSSSGTSLPLPALCSGSPFQGVLFVSIEPAGARFQFLSRLAGGAAVALAVIAIAGLLVQVRGEDPFSPSQIVTYVLGAALLGAAGLLMVIHRMARDTGEEAEAERARTTTDLARTEEDLRAQRAEREKVEEALRQSRKLESIGQLSSGIAQDFNNLLTVIKGNLKLIERRVGDSRADVIHHIHLATDALNRAVAVTQGILAFSRRESRPPKPVNMTRLVIGLSERIRQSVGDRSAIENVLDGDCWTLCDEAQMENVIINLAINAREAMPKGGRLEIETANVHMSAGTPPFEGVPEGDYVKIRVSDTGIGMTEEVRRRATDPFFTTKDDEGAGLGLSMIVGYVKQALGYLHIDSTPGKGTRVTILMPRHDLWGVSDEALASFVESSPHDVPELAPDVRVRVPTVLIVEDEPLVRTLAAETIREQGFNVIDTAHGSDALDIIKAGADIDLLVTDVRLPGVGGYQLADIALARRPTLKVILVTGFAQDPVPEKLTKAGVKMFYKPYDLDVLAATARDLLKQGVSHPA